ncbi:hypothetical protein EYF80_044423 [Liparis tanakae]|uniref:Uncharacterized protein n=1 Tax=Liparis tanakae TaxID=230148 RepID=A0A4Z2FXB3_9TELE|nr:hypothetical protein EYF80_044423 [Liparis tanakae]
METVRPAAAAIVKGASKQNPPVCFLLPGGRVISEAQMLRVAVQSRGRDVQVNIRRAIGDHSAPAQRPAGGCRVTSHRNDMKLLALKRSYHNIKACAEPTRS